MIGTNNAGDKRPEEAGKCDPFNTPCFVPT